MQPGLAWVYMYALNSEIKLRLVMSYGSSRVVTVPSAVSSIPKDSPTNLDILTHYLRRLTDEAQYLEIVKQGHWMWAYDNINIHMRARHERQGLFNSTNAVASFPGL